MFKPFSLLFFIAVFTWIVRIFLVTDGSERIERSCTPVEILGQVTISATALVADQYTGNMQATMNQWVYGCRYVVWRSFYEEDYLRYQTESEAAADPLSQAPSDPAEKRGPAKGGAAENRKPPATQ